MNYPFIFTPQMNPFADNPGFIKKALSPRLLLISIIGMTFLLISLIFGAACFFNFNTINHSIQTQAEDEINILLSTTEGVGQVFYSIIMFFPLLAFIMIYVRVKSDEYDLNILPFHFLRIFLILSVISSVPNILNSVTSPMSDELFSEGIDSEKLAGSLILTGLPSLISAVWAVFGILFISSFIQTLQCKKLEAKFARIFTAFSLIYALTLLGTTTYYCISGFKDALFSSYDSVNSSVRPIIIQSMQLAPVMFVVYYVSCVAVILSCALLARSYYFAVSSAVRSFNASNSNLFMNSDSKFAAYFGAPYTSPQTVQSPPPAAVQQYEKVSDPVSTSEESAISAEENDNIDTTASVSAETSVPVRRGTYICPKCGTMNLAENKYCSHCGNNCMNT